MKFSSDKLIFLGLALGIYLLSAGTSYAAFSYFRPGIPTATVENKDSKSKNAGFTTPQKKYANLPKTEECPLSGAMYSKPEKDLWVTRRPLGVMVENTKEARPQSGLTSADVVYEAVAEGGVTRFLAVFYCQDSLFIGPVRSARTYFLDWISEYGNSPLYAHVGGANTPGPADALGQIERYGWSLYNDLNQFSVPFPYMWRDLDRIPGAATEHTVYTSSQKLWEYAAKKRGLTNIETDDMTGKQIAWDATFVKRTFKEDAPLADRPAAFSAEFALSGVSSSYSNDFVVRWQYDHDSNSYLRFNGGVAQNDLNTNQQVLTKNIALLFMPMTIADDGYSEEGHGAHTLYGDKGTGVAKFFIDGKVITGTWAKKSRLDQTKLFDDKGAALKLNRGLTWFEILPVGQKVTIQ